MILSLRVWLQLSVAQRENSAKKKKEEKSIHWIRHATVAQLVVKFAQDYKLEDSTPVV